jgi:flagellar hook-associated protein 2
MTITNGAKSATVDLSSAVTVEDMLNAINNAEVGVRASINSAGTGIDILNVTSGTELRISDATGTTASDLGVRSMVPQTELAMLNNGRGVNTVDGDDLQITRSDGSSFNVDLGDARTIQDVIDAINTADGGAGVTASFATVGNGIVLTDTAGGAGTVTVTAMNFSRAIDDLGLNQPATGNVITGKDVNPVTPDGIFTNLQNLQNALQSNDQQAITRAAESLQTDYARLVRVRGQNGAQVQEIESRTERLEDQNLATKAVLAELEEVNITDAITRFQMLQTALQATLKSSGAMMQMSLLDFI